MGIRKAHIRSQFEYEDVPEVYIIQRAGRETWCFASALRETDEVLACASHQGCALPAPEAALDAWQEVHEA